MNITNPTKDIIVSKTIKKKLNKKYSNYNLESEYLNYDFDIDNNFKLKINNTKQLNMNLINKLPTLEIMNKPKKKSIKFKKLPKKIQQPNIDIDLDSLEKQLIGEIYYYIDYTKGIIYDINYKSVGYIDDYGDIIIT